MSTIIVGSVEEGLKWWSTADFMKRELARIYRTNNAFMQTWKQVSADAKIHVVMVAGQPKAFIYTDGGIYLESGFMTVGHVDVDIPANNAASNLYFNSFINTYLNSTNTPMELSVSVSGCSSGSVDFPFGGKQVIPGFTSKSVKKEDIVKKLALIFRLSSNYTGKLRLFVQAMYGSTRTDYALTQYALAIINGDKTRTELEYEGISSKWLLTTLNYEYYLCSVINGEIEAIPLKLTSSGMRFSEILKSHANKTDFNFATRVEAYILAYATLDIANTIYIPIPDFNITGTPLAYGWHSNWRGTELHMITLYADSVADKYFSYQYKVTITETTLGGNTTFSAELITVVSASPFCVRISDLNIITYDKVSGGMVRLPDPFPSDAIPPVFNFDAPVYCCTRLNPVSGDCELTTLYAYRNVTSRTDFVEDTGPNRIVSFTAQRIYTSHTYNGDNGSVGFYTIGYGANDFRETITNTSSYVYHDLTFDYYDATYDHPGTIQVSNLSYDNNVNWKSDAGYTSNGTAYYNSNGDWASLRSDRAYFTRTTNTNNGYYTTVKAFAEIVKDACDGFSVGTTVKSFIGTTIKHGFSGFWCWLDKLMKNSPNADYGTATSVSVAAFPGEVHARGYKVVGQPFFHGTVVDINYPDVYNNETFLTQFYDVLGKQPPTKALQTIADGDSRYFYPKIDDPLGLGVVDSAKASVQSGELVDHTLYSSDYGYVRDSSVGWA